MRKFVVVVFCGLFSSMAMAENRICPVTPSELVKVRETIDGKIVGQLKPMTPITVQSYNQNKQGRLMVYVQWSGQPLTNVKKTSLQNVGWVQRDSVSCSN